MKFLLVLMLCTQIPIQISAQGKPEIPETRKHYPYTWKSHTVARGETLKSIALAEYNDESKWKLVRGFNRGIFGVSETTPLRPGQKVRVGVPRKMIFFQSYKVEKGDTLKSIAKKLYRDSEEYRSLLEANADLAPSYSLHTGQSISSSFAYRECVAWGWMNWGSSKTEKVQLRVNGGGISAHLVGRLAGETIEKSPYVECSPTSSCYGAKVSKGQKFEDTDPAFTDHWEVWGFLVSVPTTGDNKYAFGRAITFQIDVRYRVGSIFGPGSCAPGDTLAPFPW